MKKLHFVLEVGYRTEMINNRSQEDMNIPVNKDIEQEYGVQPQEPLAQAWPYKSSRQTKSTVYMNIVSLEQL